MPRKQERGDEGRFARGNYSDDERYELVRAVAQQAAPNDPLALTIRRFNATAPAVARAKGWPPPVTAQAIQASLGKPWPTIVSEALDPQRNVQQTQVAATRAEPALDIDERTIYYALRCIAREIGDDFGPDGYDQARLALIKARRRHPGNELAAILPTSGQILALADGDWNKARRLAGLAPRKAKGRAAALPLARLIEHFYETKQAKPSSYKQLRAYGRTELGIAVADLGGRTFASHLAETQRDRRQRGLHFEKSGPRPGERLSPAERAALIAGALPASEHTRWRDRETTLTAFSAYVREYDRQVPLRQKHYVAVYAGRGWPPLKALTGHFGGFQQAVTAARRQLRRAA